MNRLTSRPFRPRTRTNLGGKFLRLTQPYRGMPVGTVIEPPAAAADILMSRGIAEEVEEKTGEEAEQKSTEPAKKKRGRPKGSTNKPKPDDT